MGREAGILTAIAAELRRKRVQSMLFVTFHLLSGNPP